MLIVKERMSNIFLSEGTNNLSSGTANIIGSNIGASNLLSGTTVKVNSNKQLYSSLLSLTDVQGLTTALGGRLSNPSSVPVIAPSFVKSGGTSSQYLMADGSVTTGAAGPTGATGPAGLSSSVFTYTFSDQTSGTPASGHLFLNAVPAEATSLVVNHIDKTNIDIDVLLDNVQIGSTVIVQRSNNSNTYRRYQITSKTISVGYVTYGLGYLAHSGSIANNEEVLLITQAQGIQGIQGPTGPTGPAGPAGGGGGDATVTNFFRRIDGSGPDTTFYSDEKISFLWDETANIIRATMLVEPVGTSTDMRSLAQMYGGSYVIARNTAIVTAGIQYQLSDNINTGLRCEIFLAADADPAYPAYRLTAYNLSESYDNVIWIQKIVPN